MSCIRELVDSLCRGQRAIYAIKQKPYNFTTNTLKAYLSAQTSSLSAFMISKTHIGKCPSYETQTRLIDWRKVVAFNVRFYCMNLKSCAYAIQW